MSVHAGSILTVGGNNVIDRIQSAGLGDVRVPVETIREVGNRLVVDKIPGEPDFTFTMETLDVSTDVMAWLCGKVGALASGSAPGNADPVGTAYSWADCGYVNVASPWKDPTTGSAGNIEAGHVIPGLLPDARQLPLRRHRQRRHDRRARRRRLLLRRLQAPVEQIAPAPAPDRSPRPTTPSATASAAAAAPPSAPSSA
jgi:hypothetical protein